MTLDEAERLAAAAALERAIAAHLANPAFMRELIEAHIIGYTDACRGADADGVARCHEAEPA